ncbi:MAG: PepSY domain-containing protein [Flavobacteriaceae bacterium]|jgi:sulfite reductase (NADPH) flavoprotein alpha-component|nr:PepSY domain-containing protein [Flavobacteriaceae bacterium]
MTLSVWRYTHLVLAVFSSLFLALASITGIILATDTVKEKISPYRVHDFDKITLSETLSALSSTYPEIIEISVDDNLFVTLEGIDKEGNDVHACIDPRTGKILGTPQKKSAFIQWVTSLHRSLFLHEAGRFFVGIIAFLLLLIAGLGIILVIQRQRGLRRFFSKTIKDYFAQHYHVVVGRLLLIPIVIIALTGTYLSMVRFKLLPEYEISRQTHTEISEDITDKKNIAEFSVFKNTPLAEVRNIEFPFSDDPEEYYTLKLKEREIQVSQFTGEILSEVVYPQTVLLENLSLDLHTGRTSIVWAVILVVASLSILFFIYSGFTITLRRRVVRIKNKYKPSESKFILLAGSENGSTLRFADAIHKQLLSAKQTSYLTELNNYTVFPKAEHIIVFTSTHGLGDAPSNANKLASLIKKHPQKHTVNISVVGFGSRAYPDFCGYARKVDALLAAQDWANPLLDLYTVSDKSPEQFIQWVKAWSRKTEIPLVTVPALYGKKPANLQKMTVLEKTAVDDIDQTFILTICPGMRAKFTSGDLLAIYPAGDGRERLYSIGKSKGNIQLVVKLHPSGLGSGYLYGLTPGSVIRARIIRNAEFHFPEKAPVVAMIANGTGIAPFMGMIEGNKKKTECHLYCGFRKETEIVRRHGKFVEDQVRKQYLKSFHIAFSREGNQCYVMDLVRRDADFFSHLLQRGGMLMICGSRAMQQDVETVLDAICMEKNGNGIAYYKSKGQILIDCY